MSVEHTNKVDFISIDPHRNVVLTISDPLDWERETEHLFVLQEKINAYLRFIESGEIDEVYPNGRGLPRSISIIARFEPTQSGLQFLSNAKQSIEAAGFGFRFEIRTE